MLLRQRKSPTKSINLNFIIFFSLILITSNVLVESGASLLSSNNTNKEDSGDERQQEQTNAISNDNLSSSIIKPLKFECPVQCHCIRIGRGNKLQILCQRHEDGNSNSTKKPSSTLDVTNGIKGLTIRNVNIGSEAQLKATIPLMRENHLQILELHDVTLEPVSFFKTQLFRSSRYSLNRLEITTTKVSPHDGAKDFIENQRTLVFLSRLEELDKITISDSSSELAQLILQSFPVGVKHIIIRNSGLSDISPVYFEHLRSLDTLDLSGNQLKTFPSTLTQNLQNLRWLDISRNNIEHLQEQVFQGLGQLQRLNASHNHIHYVDIEVFNPLVNITSIDISFNDVIQFFEPYFENNPLLKKLWMRRTWTHRTFIDPETGARSRMEMEKLLNTLLSVDNLDLSDNEMLIIPETLTHAPRLSRVNLHGNPWSCSCEDRWFTHWLASTNVKLNPHNSNQTNLMCHSGSTVVPVEEYLQNCTNKHIYSRIPRKYYTHMGLSPTLHCHPQRANGPIITWITPQKLTLRSDGSSFYSQSTSSRNLEILEGGNLRITNFTKSDYGLYKCIAQYPDLNITHYIHVGVDTYIFSDVRIMSFIIGWATSFAFLLLVIITHFVRVLLTKCGVECTSVGKSYQSRRVRAFFESMEQHKSTQLDWLRDNYNMQAKKIKDNCFTQLERIRESYTVQHKNVSDIREYGTNQLHQLRDQYCDQIRRVSGYSTHQLCKVRENYLFQRNRVCKFSSHQLLRLRETYKWQAQTLNKILENLPRTLNLDTCRGIGTCGRTDSIYLEDISEFHSIDDSPYPPEDAINAIRLPSEKMEHVSLLIPPEFMTPPEYPRELGLLRRYYTDVVDPEPFATGTVLVHAEAESSSSENTPPSCSRSDLHESQTPPQVIT